MMSYGCGGRPDDDGGVGTCGASDAGRYRNMEPEDDDDPRITSLFGSQSDTYERIISAPFSDAIPSAPKSQMPVADRYSSLSS